MATYSSGKKRRTSAPLQAVYCLGVLILVLAGSAHGQEAGSGPGACLGEEQPVLTAIDPPSGTTDITYTISGSALDEVASVTLQQGEDTLAVEIQEGRSDTSIKFEISSSVEDGLATVTLVPNNAQCQSPSTVIDLRDGNVLLGAIRPPGTGQIGTVFHAIGCIPDQCGDNSTSFNLTVGGIVLELLNVTLYGIEDPTEEVIARFPPTDREPFEGEQIRVVTEYNTFDSVAFIDYQLPGRVDSVTPDRGQRGTRVVITGENLDGIGEGVEVVSVLLGGYAADIELASDSEIVVRASGGSVTGDDSILIQSNQTLAGVPGFTFEGPYLSADGVWTQLLDGVITDVVPTAAQVGRTLTLCGERLLGGGTGIDSVEIVGQASDTFDGTPTPTELNTAGSECITVVVPEVEIPEPGLRGVVTLEADTQAIITTTGEVDFSYAEIRAVTPSEGQAGTLVVISGVELLSGLTTETPTVYLSGVEAALVSFESTSVVVQAQAPPVIDAGSASGSGESGMGLMPVDSTIFDTPGSVVIVVNNSQLVPRLSFNVSLDMAWRYLPPGEILSIFPPFGQYGTRIFVMGENLLGYGQTLLMATVNGSEATILSSNNTVVVIEAPDLDIVEFVRIILYSDTGAPVTGEVFFEYRQRGEIESLSPATGQFGTFVMITGTNLFGHGGGISNVMFGNLEAEIDSISATSTSVRVRIPMNDNPEPETVSVQIISDTSAIVDSGDLTWTYLVQGQVTSVSPSQGQEGTRVTITGESLLGGGELLSTILLDGVVPTGGDVVTDTTITVTMGDISTQEDTARGQVFIQSNTGAMVTGGVYTHQPSGQITAFTPQVGREGTLVTITGINLRGYGNEVVSVEIAGVAGDVVSESNTEVIARVAAASQGMEGPITLMTDTGAIVSSADDNTFTYEQPGSITSVTPSEGAEGSGVLISGVALRTASTRVVNVTFGGSPVSRIVTETETEVSVIAGAAPDTNPSMAPIMITVNDGSFVDGMSFSYQELTITLLGRTSGQQGTIIEIGLPDDDSFSASFELRAFIDDQEAVIVGVDTETDTIEVSVPRASMAGTYQADVAVEGIDRLVARLPDGFTYLPEGVIYSVSPSRGQRGTNVLLQGDNLLGGGSTISSAIIELSDGSEVDVNVDSSTDNEVGITILENPTGVDFPIDGDIILTADTGAIIQRLNAFTFVTPGEIDSFLPTNGQVGTYVTISGTNLLQGMSLSSSELTVTVAGTQATVQPDEFVSGFPTPPPLSDTHITVRLQSPSDPTPQGPVEIVLPTGATVTSTEGFLYTAAGSIDTVSPSSGTEGTRVTISGSNLRGGGSSLLQVLLGGVPANIDTDSDEMVVVTAQEGGDLGSGAGPTDMDVEIITDTGAVIAGEGLWTYESPGHITGVTPTIGQQGVVVTITGESFLGSDPDNVIEGCVLAGVPGEVVSSSDEEVKCRASYSATTELLTGVVHIAAQSGTGVQSDPSVNFTYYPAQINQIDPSSGTNGTFVNITGLSLLGEEGSNFTVRNVTFGNILATVTDVLPSGNSIIVRVGESQAGTSGDRVRVTSTSGAYLDLETAWSYLEPGVINSISPDFGFPGETIRISGVNLVPPVVCIPSRESLRVILGQSESFNATEVNSTTVEFRPGIFQGQETADEPVPIQVIAPSGATVFTDAVAFRYNATGNVTSVDPLAGGVGSEVTITGTGLLSGGAVASVTLAGYEATVMEANDTLVVVVAGPGPTSEPGITEGVSGPVVIEANNSRLVGLPGSVWTYLPILSSTPSSGQEGTIVTIEDFSRISAANYTLEGVTLNGVPATINGTDPDGNLVVRAGPSPATSAGDVVLQLSSGVNLIIPDAWTYLSPVVLNDITPDAGYFNTGVVLTGSNFQAGGVSVIEVTLAELSTEIISQTDFTLEVRITEMENSSLAEIIGSVCIISEQGATFTSTSTFTYVQVDLQSLSPDMGQGGTVVTIGGIGLLLGGDSVSSVLFGDQEASINSTSDTAIVVIAPASPVSVSGINISYTVNTEATFNILESWDYVAPGQITAVSPSQGNEGTIVTIRGNAMFAGGDRAEVVHLGDVPAMEILVNTEVLVQVRAGFRENPTMSGSSTDDELRVTIVTDTGSTTSSDVASGITFEYLEPGQVTSITPMSGQAGTVVTIEGTRLSENGEEIDRVWLAGVLADIIDANLTSGGVSVEAVRPSVQGTFSGPVTIESTRGTLTQSSQNFTYNTEGMILLVEPNRGQVGTRVQITGERLQGGGASVLAVFLAGVPAMMEFESDDEIRVVVNSITNINNDVTGDIIIQTDSGAIVRRIDGWTYVEPGNISAVIPPEGQFGTEIVITGAGLLSGGTSISMAHIDNIAAYDIISSNDTKVVIRAGSPPSSQAFATESFTLVSDFGGTLVFDFPWNYLMQSNITNVTPDSGIGGSSVELRGTNLLGGGTEIFEVQTNGISATSIDPDSNDTSVRFTAGFNPSGINSTGDIVVTSDSGALTIRLNGWTYENECPVGQFGTVDNCFNCSVECESCFGPTDTECFECSNFRILLPNSTMQCVSQCPNVSTLDFQCVDACESNEYARTDSQQQAKFCYQCNPLCDSAHSCSGPNATQCGRCASLYNTITGSCVEMCPNFTFIDESNNCVPCNAQCDPETGCNGATAADCVECRNLVFQVSMINVSIPNDICVANCAEAFYEEDQFCRPCSTECAGGCMGPSSNQCDSCRNFEVASSGNASGNCVSTCNTDPSRMTMYGDANNFCQPCSPLCSLTGGCSGPNATDCNGCRNGTTEPLPTLNGECVLACPPTTHYHDTAIEQCVTCDPSCSNGCTGPTSSNCITDDESDDPFEAGAGTIAIVIVVVVALLIILVVLVIFLVWRLWKYRSYKVSNDAIELERADGGNRYSQAPPTRETEFAAEASKSKTPETKEVTPAKTETAVGVSNAAFDDGDVYTEMGPEDEGGEEPRTATGSVVQVSELYVDVAHEETKQNSVSKDSGEPTAPPRPEKPSVKPPAALPQEKAEKPPPRPPSPETYTDMTASVQEVFVNPVADEEYSEMLPGVSAVNEDYYDDAGSLKPASATASAQPTSKSEEKAPLLTADAEYGNVDLGMEANALYEETDVAIAAAEEYKAANAPLIDQPPQLPSRNTIPKRKSSAPLPQTPLEKSIARTSAPVLEEEMYVEPGMPIEESLYEAIPLGPGARLLQDESPPPPIKPKGKMPSKSASVPVLPPKPKPRKT